MFVRQNGEVASWSSGFLSILDITKRGVTAEILKFSQWGLRLLR
jgi:hypothetical protein